MSQAGIWVKIIPDQGHSQSKDSEGRCLELQRPVWLAQRGSREKGRALRHGDEVAQGLRGPPGGLLQGFWLRSGTI